MEGSFGCPFACCSEDHSVTPGQKTETKVRACVCVVHRLGEVLELRSENGEKAGLGPVVFKRASNLSNFLSVAGLRGEGIINKSVQERQPTNQ